MNPGYASTPLLKKLGLKAGARVCLIGAPPHYLGLLGPLPGGIRLCDAAEDGLDFAQLFATERRVLEAQTPLLAPRLALAGMLWLCWPKKASSIATDLTREAVRDVGLGTGLVDVKVCAIDADWSGLKFVRRLADR